MSMEGFVPMTIVLALGVGTLGTPDALRVLLDHAGQNPVVDITTCVLFIGVVTAQILGVVLLARFIRKAPAQAGAGDSAAPRRRAPAADCFAKMTLTVSVGVGLFVSACLVVVVPGGGLTSPTRLAFDVAGKSPVTAILVICAAGSLPCIIVPLLRVFREAGNASGAGAVAAPATRATERYVGMTRTAYLTALSLVGTGLLLCNSFVEPDGLAALRLRHGFTGTFVGVGALLLARFSRRRAHNAAVVPSPATVAERFGKLRRNAFLMAVLCFALAAGVLSVIQYAYASPAHMPGGGKRTRSA